MKRVVIACLVAMTLPSTVSVADAAVLYTFDGGSFASFSYVANDLITTDAATFIPAADLQSCIGFFDESCASVTFGEVFSTSPTAVRDLIVTTLASPPPLSIPPNTFRFLFDGDAFSTYGVHKVLAGVSGTLTVSAIPEPATWALMLLGFGMTAAAVRYRRREGVVPSV